MWGGTACPLPCLFPPFPEAPLLDLAPIVLTMISLSLLVLPLLPAGGLYFLPACCRSSRTLKPHPVCALHSTSPILPLQCLPAGRRKAALGSFLVPKAFSTTHFSHVCLAPKVWALPCSRAAVVAGSMCLLHKEECSGARLLRRCMLSEYCVRARTHAQKAAQLCAMMQECMLTTLHRTVPTASTVGISAQSAPCQCLVTQGSLKGPSRAPTAAGRGRAAASSARAQANIPSPPTTAVAAARRPLLRWRRSCRWTRAARSTFSSASTSCGACHFRCWSCCTCCTCRSEGRAIL